MAETPEISTPEAPRTAWWAGPWPIVVVCFVWCMYFYTRNYAHPYYYEKDATTKVQQVMGGDRNYFHPLLMLNTTDALIKLSGTTRTDQNVSNVGHIVMSIFAAVTVAVFVLFAFRCGGWALAFAVGVFLALNDELLTRAHYFKEDPALVVGLAFAFLAMKLFNERPTLGRAAWVGVACAVAISGKYVGVAALILAIPLVLVPPGRRLARLGILLGVCLVVMLAINWQWVVDFGALRRGFGTEMHDLTGREEMLKKVPHTQFVIKLYQSDLPRLVAIGVLLQIAWLTVSSIFPGWERLSRSPDALYVETSTPGSRRPVEWMLIIYPVVFTVILNWSPRLFERHFLPVFVCLWVSSGLGWVNAIRALWLKFTRLPAWGGALAGTVVVALCASRLQHNFMHRHHEFASDHRAQLAKWIREHVPADAVIAQDRRVYLTQPDGSPRPELGLTQKIVTAGWLSDFGSLAELRKRGVTYLAMHKLDSGGLMEGGKFLNKEAKEAYSGRDRPARRAFYKEIETHSKRLWEHKDGDDGAMNPGLLFYALEPEK